MWAGRDAFPARGVHSLERAGTDRTAPGETGARGYVKSRDTVQGTRGHAGSQGPRSRGGQTVRPPWAADPVQRERRGVSKTGRPWAKGVRLGGERRDKRSKGRWPARAGELPRRWAAPQELSASRPVAAGEGQIWSLSDRERRHVWVTPPGQTPAEGTCQRFKASVKSQIVNN